MKTKDKQFDTVKYFREIKKKIAEETKDMNFEEFKEYLSKSRLRKEKNAEDPSTEAQP